ncbi:MAG: P-II family nitrogen regulator [Salinarimonas sp.]
MTIPATKISIVAERFLLPQIERVLAAEKVSGYSTFPGGGKGSHGVHPADAASLVREFSIVKLEAVMLDRTAAERIAEALATHAFQSQSGIVWLESVEVVRAEKFGSEGG